MPKFRIVVSTGFAGCDHTDEIEIEQEEWNEMSEKERDDVLWEACETLRNNHIDWYWTEV